MPPYVITWMLEASLVLDSASVPDWLLSLSCFFF